MLKVSEILQVKGDALYTASPDSPVAQAVNTMSEQDIGSLVIMEHGTLVGMLTFREIIQLIHKQGSIGNATIRAIMDDAPEKHARYIPVLDGTVLMGVISFYDMARAIVAAQRFENDMLKAYIRDWPADDEGKVEFTPPTAPTPDLGRL